MIIHPRARVTCQENVQSLQSLEVEDAAVVETGVVEVVEGVEVAASGALEGAEVVGGVAVGRIHLDWILINLNQGVAVGMPFFIDHF